MARNMRRMLGLTLMAAGSAPAVAQSLEWIQQFGTPVNDTRAFGIAVDGAGGVYITGSAGGSLFGPSAGADDAFLAKYDASGELQWARQFGTSAEDRGYGVALDSVGGVYIAGRTINAGWPTTGDAFLARSGDSGEMQMQQFGTPAVDSAESVAVDSAGGVYIAGFTGGSLFGPSAGDYDAFLAKYDASGDLQWARQFGTPEGDSANGVAVDSAGGVYIAGHTDGSLGGPSAGMNDAFLAKYNPAGELQWTRQLGTSGQDYANAVAVDSEGEVYIAGETYRSLGGPSAGGVDAFLAKYDGSGALQWTRQLGTPETDKAHSVAVDSSGGVYITGSTFNGSLGGPSAGLSDAFLARYDASGTLHWTRQFGTEWQDVAFGVAVVGAADVYIAGYTGGSLGGPIAGFDDAFLAKYHASTCYADCDDSFSLDFFDFLCFQDLFATGDSLADCDGSGSLDFQDFLCFQGEFAAGCP